MSDAQWVLIVDHNVTRAAELASLLTFLEYRPVLAADNAALGGLKSQVSNPIAAFVCADKGYQFLQSTMAPLKEFWPTAQIFITSNEEEDGLLPDAVRKQTLGLLGYPFSYKDILGALRQAEMVVSARDQSSGEGMSQLFRSLVGHGEAVQQVRELVRQVACTEANVLILGESGTGKEVVARNIHFFSKRRGKPFVPVNCGAIPSELLESELFGHEKGAFTGAISSRQGRFEIAEGGTLFLDEIGDMPLSMQVKLLRVIQERTFERVGSNKSITADVRIVAATHQNLEQLVAEGKFRMDLYYRLNVFPIEVPPLRERVGDIPLLVKEFVTRMEMEKRGSVQLTDSALAALTRYPWPGNVRELANLIERLAILFPGQLVNWHDLPDKFRANEDWLAEQTEQPREHELQSGEYYDRPRLPKAGIDLKTYLNDLEYNLIHQALEESGWVVARAAKLLSLQRTTLVEKMRKFSLSRPEEMSEN